MGRAFINKLTIMLMLKVIKFKGEGTSNRLSGILSPISIIPITMGFGSHNLIFDCLRRVSSSSGTCWLRQYKPNLRLGKKVLGNTNTLLEALGTNKGSLLKTVYIAEASTTSETRFLLKIFKNTKSRFE